MNNEPKCNPHPKAPHGFDRNSSHSAHRYVCDCESWEPYQAGYDEGFQAGMKAEQALEQSAVEPVAWRVHPATYGVGHDGVYALTTRTEQVDAWRRKGWEVEPLYTAPQAQQEKP